MLEVGLPENNNVICCCHTVFNFICLEIVPHSGDIIKRGQYLMRLLPRKNMLQKNLEVVRLEGLTLQISNPTIGHDSYEGSSASQLVYLRSSLMLPLYLLLGIKSGLL
jgi:hypothetical protein